MTKTQDRWHRWLLDVRHGGDVAYRERMLSELYQVRDKVLDRADLQPGETLLDVGTGAGLIAFGALDRLGPSARVIFSDISADLLDHCRAAVEEGGQLNRCEFVVAGADQLASVADASVDVVTTRSVLIYVRDKAAAFAEFRRGLLARRAGEHPRAHQCLDGGLQSAVALRLRSQSHRWHRQEAGREVRVAPAAWPGSDA